MAKAKEKAKPKRKKSLRVKLKDLPKYTEIKQIVEATQRRMLLEPVQKTQSPDIIVYQNGVLDLKCTDPNTAFRYDNEAPLKHSHAVWSYFDPAMWVRLSGHGSHLLAEKKQGEHFSKMRKFCAETVPVFSRYMTDWFPQDRAAFEVVLRWFGYSFTTDYREQKFFFFYGPTRAGKGSLARLLCGLVGSNNYNSANYAALEEKFQAIGMHDRLVVTMEEVEATPKEHERRLGMLKKYLGGERVMWEAKYRPPFEDSFIGKIIMQSNEALAYEDKGRSVTARMIPLEFQQSFEGSGAEPPEKAILGAGEGDRLATLAGMMWYRMRRNMVRGAFDFNEQSWSVGHCKGCRRGRGSLMLERHKVLWPFLVHFGKPTVTEKEEIEKMLRNGNLILCDRKSLKEITEQLLEVTGKTADMPNIIKLLRDSIMRDFPGIKEKCYNIKEVGRVRGWKRLYIDMQRLRFEYPELFDNTEDSHTELLK
jgi:hypothetical protein